MTLHVAFLRGVGGPRPAPGAELKSCLGAAGYDLVGVRAFDLFPHTHHVEAVGTFRRA